MHKPQATLPPLRRLRVITYRVTLDVPLQLALKVSNLLEKHQAELGTRNGTRALTCWQQAMFVLADASVDAVLHAYRISVSAVWTRFGDLARQPPSERRA